jgi:hypothetical protein
MKKLVAVIAIVLGILLPQFIVAQSKNCTIINKLIITEASVNGVDITRKCINGEASIVFYRVAGFKYIIYMSNFWSKSNSQSCGKVYEAQTWTTKATTEKSTKDICFLSWCYKNSYDDKKGTAKVEIIRIPQSRKNEYAIIIMPENLDVLIYKGYMDKPLDFSLFN